MNPLLALRAVGALALPVMTLSAAAGRRRDRRAAARAGDASEPEPVTTGLGSAEELGLAVDPERTVPHHPKPAKRQLRALRDRKDELRRYDLRGVDLRGWDLEGLDLPGVDLSHARLRRADLRAACLAYARLHYADLSGADLRGANLHGATLLETDLAGADLRGVDLRHVHQLPMANLRQARIDRTTKWPQGFDPQLAMAPRL